MNCMEINCAADAQMIDGSLGLNFDSETILSFFQLFGSGTRENQYPCFLK